MTSTITEVTITTIRSNTYDTLSSSFGVVAVLLLLLLLIWKELLRVHGGRHSSIWMQSINVAIGPLFLVFGLIIALRFFDLLY